MNSHTVLEFSLPPLFSFQECLWFLNRNFDDCMHSITGNKVIKAIDLQGRLFLISVEENEGILKIVILKGNVAGDDSSNILKYVKEWLDIDKDPAPLYELMKQHSGLSYMAEAYRGLRLVGIPDLFEALSWGIIGQQINLTFAYKLKRRLVERYADHLDYKGQKFYLFPSFTKLAGANITELREMQFSQKKAEYIIGLANAFLNDEINETVLRSMPDLKDKQKKLTSIRGIGVWTANYALMKSFREPSCIPYGDAGLLNALIAHDIIDQKDENHKIDLFFERYKGWESYMVFYLWRSLSKM